MVKAIYQDSKVVIGIQLTDFTCKIFMLESNSHSPNELMKVATKFGIKPVHVVERSTFVLLQQYQRGHQYYTWGQLC